MPREIKFRVWDYITEKFDDQIYRVGEQFGHPSSCDWHPQQYTGLKDKNGKEIYEGDIINGYLTIDEIGAGGYINSNEWEFTGEVKFEGCGFYCPNADFPIDQYEILEVIGNIFENKELLENYSTNSFNKKL